MSIHIHTLRNCCARALVLLPAPLLFGWALPSESTNFELAQVSGRVTCADRPISGEIIFLPDAAKGPFASGRVDPDGSFQLYINGRLDQRGAMPGTYRVVVLTRVPDKTGSRLDSKYQDARTTDLRVHVTPDWNYFRFNLH